MNYTFPAKQTANLTENLKIESLDILGTSSEKTMSMLRWNQAYLGIFSRIIFVAQNLTKVKYSFHSPAVDDLTSECATFIKEVNFQERYKKEVI